jgi:hypothetical protein
MMAHNRKRARARTWVFEDLDRDQAYVLYFDPASFRWEVMSEGSTAPLVTRVHLNRRSAWDGDRE